MKLNVENLPSGHVCCLHDYSESYSCQYQDQIQTLFFKSSSFDSRNNLAPSCSVTEHLFVISPDIKHDNDSVHECRALIAGYLKQINYPITVMHEWTDGCSSQYKSCHCMGDVSNSKMDFGFLTIRNYFETSHAKGPQDGAGANLKHKADMAVVRRQVIIQNARDLYDYAKANLTEPSSTRYKSQSVGLKRRIFFFVDQHNRNRRNGKFKPIKGSRQIHSISGTDQSAGCLKTRLLSCYCDSCLDGEYGSCENHDLVDEWEEISIEQEVTTRRVTRAEAHEQQAGILDLVSEGSFVAIASGDPGEDYYLLKVSEGPKDLQTPTKDDWGATYPAGAEVLTGHFLIQVAGTRSRHYNVDYSRKALVYASTATFLCTDVRSLPCDTLQVTEEEHLNILHSVDGF